MPGLKVWFDGTHSIYSEAEASKRTSTAKHEASTNTVQAAILSTYANSFKVANPARLAESALRDIVDYYRWF